MKLATTALVFSIAGLAVSGAIAAFASVPLAALSVTAAANSEEEFSRGQPATLHTAGTSPVGYYAIHAR